MAIKEKIDFSTFTDRRSSKDLYANSVRKGLKYDAFGGQTKFQAIVISDPIPFSPQDLQFFTGDTGKLKKILNNINNTTTQFSYRARIIGDNSPHSFLPDPCDSTYASDSEAALKIIAMHTLFVSNEEGGAANSVPRLGSKVEVELTKNVFGYNLQFGKHSKLVANPEPSTASAEACDTLVSAMASATGGATAVGSYTGAGGSGGGAATTGNGLGRYRPANRKPGDVKYVIIHNTDSAASNWTQHPTYGKYAKYNGSAAGTAASMGKSTRVSIHYATDSNGNIAPLVPEKDIATHGPGNYKSIGIEMVGYHQGVHSSCVRFDPGFKGKKANGKPRRWSGCPPVKCPAKDPSRGTAGPGYSFMYTTELVDSTAQLVAEILIRWELTPSKSTVKTHADTDPSRRSDPGHLVGNFDYSDFLKRVEKFYNQNPSNVQPLSGVSMDGLADSSAEEPEENHEH